MTKALVAESIVLVIPEPPSANVYYRRGFKGAPHESREAKIYKGVVSMLTSRHRTGAVVPFPSGDLSLAVLWHRSRKSGDLDNRLKILTDSLQGCAFRNDNQIAHIEAERVDSHVGVPKGFMRVEIRRFSR